MRRNAVLLAAVAAVAVSATPALAQKQTLKMAHWSGPAHQMVQTQEAWAKTVLDASGGNLVIEIDKAPLAKPEGQYDLIKNGIRDLVWHIPAYTPGRMDMMRVVELPFTCPNSTICSPVLWRWYEKYKLADREFTDGTTLVNTFTTGPFLVHTTKPARTLEEIRALKLRIAGAGVPIGKALGFNVVALPATDAYETLQRGTVDGTLFPWEAVNSFRLVELLKYHLEIPGGVYASAFMIVGNSKAIANLTPSNREALMKMSAATGSQLYGKAWDAADERGRVAAKAKGNIIETIKPEELNRWRPLLQFVTDDWIAKAKEKGLDGAAMYEDLKAMIKAASS
jgi:TRAP-type C4-dicarboxylate transport system substrate-binding protein